MNEAFTRCEGWRAARGLGRGGALAVSATGGWIGRVHRYGRAIALAAAGWGLAITGFGLAPDLAVALGCLFAAGAADMVSGIFGTGQPSD
jgi:hypothetical protein